MDVARVNPPARLMVTKASISLSSIVISIADERNTINLFDKWVVTRYTDDIFRHIPLIAGIRQSQKGNDGQLNADEGEQVTLPVEKGQKAETQREKAELLLRLQQSGSS